jgi:hypothetical protein
MREIELLVGFGPGGRIVRLHHDLIHNGFELTELLTKRSGLGMIHVCCFGGGVKQVIIVLPK